jgi:hypothetical protein
MAVYMRYCTKYRTKIGRFSTKGLILASLLVIGGSAPLRGQEAEQDTVDQEMVEQEMPDEASDQEIEAEQDAQQDSQDSAEQESSEQDNTEIDSAGPESGPDLEAKQDAQEQKTEQSEPVAKSEQQDSGAQAKPGMESASSAQAVSTQDKAVEKNEAEKPVALQKATQEIPALALEEIPAQAPKPAISDLVVGAPVAAKPVLASKNGLEQNLGAGSVTQPWISPVAQPGAKPVTRPEPKVPAQERPDQVMPEDEDIVGIDTVSLDDPQGNWLFKRIWWERAEKKIEKIRRLVNAVFESRVIFLAQRTDIDRNVLDPFYVSIGLGQGELKNILDQLIARLEKEREKEGALSEQERGILQELRKEESALKQMKTDVENVARIDHDIDEALNTLFEQINKVREYEGDAWDNFKEIARVLNDIKARELYYTMDIIAKNIEDIQAYIQQDYTRHFNQLSSTAKQQIDRLKKAIDTMRERGLDLGKQLELLEQQEKARTSGQDLESEEEDDEPEAEQGFFSSYIMAPVYYIGSALKGLLDGVVSVVTWPINYLTGATGDAEQEKEDKEEDED